MSYSASAPRLPLSPASSPGSGVKQQPKYESPRRPACSLPSPVDHMSVATKRYVSSYEDSRHTNEMAARSPPNYQSQPTRPSLNHTASHQTNPLKRPLSQDEGERSSSKRQKKEDDGPHAAHAMDVEYSFASSDYESQLPESTHHPKGAVTFNDGTGAEQATESTRVELDAIFKDVGPALRTRSLPHNRTDIRMHDHLLGKFGLHGLLTKVARIDPVTGEKINKLRKSYEGQVKSLGLAGRNKPHKEERADDEPSKLRKMGQIPEESWKQLHESAPKIGDFEGLRNVMHRALRINQGLMTSDTMAEWDEVLGHEARKPGQQQKLPQPSSQQSRIPNGVRQPPTSSLSNPLMAQDKMRTRGKKRSYGDASFDGYPGYADGNSETDDISDRDRDYADRGKRRKNN